MRRLSEPRETFSVPPSTVQGRPLARWRWLWLLGMIPLLAACSPTSSSMAPPAGGDPNPRALPALPVTSSGRFATQALRLSIEISSRGCRTDSSCPEGLEGARLDALVVEVLDQDSDSVPLESVSVWADGASLAMNEGTTYGWAADLVKPRSVGGAYTFEIVADGQSRLSGLNYRSDTVAPHQIIAPEPGAVLETGESVEVEWQPSSARLSFQVSMLGQPYDAAYLQGDAGRFALPSEALSQPETSDELIVSRRAIHVLEGMPSSRLIHTHTEAVAVSVVNR